MSGEEEKNNSEHKRMIDILWRNKGILAKAFGLDASKLFVRGREYVLDSRTNERADLVFQDRWCASQGDSGATCFAVELKSDVIDHEVLGQLKKAVDILTKIGKNTGHWGRVVGMAIGKKFTQSGLSLLSMDPYYSFEWCESGESVRLAPVGPLFAPLAGSPDGIIRKARKKVPENTMN
jgi:hypothetical protein